MKIYECPNCGADLRINTVAMKCTCEYCNASIVVTKEMLAHMKEIDKQETKKRKKDCLKNKEKKKKKENWTFRKWKNKPSLQVVNISKQIYSYLCFV